MSRRSLILAVAIGLALLASLTHRARKAHAELTERYDSVARYVDMGVMLKVVRRDPAGVVKLGDLPAMSCIRQHVRGGIIDTAPDPIVEVDGTQTPIVWYCSEATEAILLHSDPAKSRQLVYGAMGAGKTTLLAQWLYLRALEHTGEDAEGGATAPTNERTRLIARAIRDLWPRKLWRWKERDQTFTLANRVTIRLISTHRQSEAEGSRIQGYTWAFAASDEIQDSSDEDPNIEARGRGARGGIYPRMATATAKDSPAWRTFRDHLETSGEWSIRHLRGPESPFVAPTFWTKLSKTLSDRDYKRIVGAEDIGPELMTYYTWSRADNVRPVPRIGAEDVTAQVLAPYGQNLHALVGHDPGDTVDVSIVLKAYKIAGQPGHSWWVVDELTTEMETIGAHVAKLKQRLERFGLYRTDVKGRPLAGSPVALVRADPYTDNGSEKKTDKQVYTVFQNAGMDIRPATYAKIKHGSQVIGQVDPGQIQKNAGIRIVVGLLKSHDGVRRLFVDCDESRNPKALRLVETMERSERDLYGKAETQKKAKGDLSHWAAALRYALFEVEKERFAGLLGVST